METDAVSSIQPHARTSAAPPELNEARTTAVDDIYGEHAPLLRALARGRFRIPLSDVDALVHDVFATFFTNPSVVRNVRPYLVGGICNAAREYWRRRQRDEAIFVDVSPEEVVTEEILQSLTVTLTLNAMLAQLNQRCRDILRAYYLDREPTAAIAAAMDTSPGNVLYLLHNCRKKARAITRKSERPRE